jgi:hypothetical protein
MGACLSRFVLYVLRRFLGNIVFNCGEAIHYLDNYKYVFRFCAAHTIYRVQWVSISEVRKGMEGGISEIMTTAK